MAYDPNDPFQQLQKSLGQADIARLGRWILLGVLLLVALLGVGTSVYTVQTEGQAVVTRFGKVVAIQPPGLHFKMPFGIDRAVFVPTEVALKEEFGFRTRAVGQRTVYEQTEDHLQEALMLTGDLNVIEVQWVVHYRVRNSDAAEARDDLRPAAERFLHRVDNPVRTIRDISEAVIRRIVGNRLVAEALTIGRVEIATQAAQEIQEILDRYEMGVRITSVELQDISPPGRVQAAFNEVNMAEQERDRLRLEAEMRANTELPRARGEAQQIRSEAEGYATERVNRAQGDADRFLSVVAEYRLAPEVTRRRMYLETLDEVLPKAGSVLVVEPGTASPLPLMDMNTRRPAAGGGR